MKILFLTHRLPYAPNRGDRIRAYHLLREMSRFAEVSLLSLTHDDEELSHRDRVPFTREVTCLPVQRMRNLALAAARLPTARPITHSLLDATGIHDALRDLIGRHSPDLVVAFCSGMARFAFEPPLEGRPFVLDMVDVDSVKWDRMADASRGPLRWIYRREARTLRAFERTATTRARATLVVNERERTALAQIAPGARITVVPAGIDLDAFRPPAPPTGDPVVIFCGVMSYAPNEMAREVVRIERLAASPRRRAGREIQSRGCGADQRGSQPRLGRCVDRSRRHRPQRAAVSLERRGLGRADSSRARHSNESSRSARGWSTGRRHARRGARSA